MLKKLIMHFLSLPPARSGCVTFLIFDTHKEVNKTSKIMRKGIRKLLSEMEYIKNMEEWLANGTNSINATYY